MNNQLIFSILHAHKSQSKIHNIMHYMSYLFRITSAAISNDGQLMCAGFEDSAVRLWSLTPKKLVVNQASFHDLSRINFGIGLNSLNFI